LREHLEGKGVEFMTGRPATSVIDADDGAEVRFADGASRSFDNVVLTIPCARAAAMCPQLTDGERQRLNDVVYQGIACASVLLRKPLADYYVTNITESWVPFTAVIEMTALVDRSRFGGNALVYLPRYLTQDDPFWGQSDADIRAEFLTALERMYPDFRRDDVLAFQVARAREVLALSTLHYSSTLLPPVRTSLPNVFIVNSAQIANGTLNVNETIGVANAGAIELSRYVAQRPRAPLAATRAS
jgi:protoporphyrinogen oxidase